MKAVMVGTWGRRMEIYFLFSSNITCFWGLKRQETHILASFCLFAPLSGEILSERPRMTITNALAEAKQYNVFWVFISLVNSHMSDYKPK